MKNQIKLIFLFVFIVFISLITFSQNRWVKIYHDEIDAPMKYIIESYDHGYLLSGKYEANYSRYNWLIKTDINGEILWEKTIGNGINSIVLIEMAQNDEGAIYSCGSSRHEDPYGDPFVIKLDSCVEKEWCKVFHTPDHHDFAGCICITPDNGCAITLKMTGETGWVDRICLARFCSDGELLWRQCYNSPDSLLGNEEDYNLILTPDYGFLITGRCYYTDTSTMLGWLHPYYIKTDSLGNFEWETIVHKHDHTGDGQGWSTIISPDSQYYYSSISHYHREPYGASPALLKMDMQGNVICIYDLAELNEIGKMVDARFITDSTLAASASWGSYEDAHPKAVIIDTLGNIINEQFLLDNDYMSRVRKTFDDKLLYYTHTYLENDEKFDTYLFKLNFELEDDTLYTQPFTYDSLCPYPIVSDTIVQDDCDLIVGMEEVKPEKEEENDGILIYPNPAQNIINIEYPIMNDECRSLISIYDIFGRKVKEIYATKGQTEIIVNVSKWHRGIYIAVLWQNGKLIAKEKFMIIR